MFFIYIWNTVSNNKLPIALLTIGALVPCAVFYHRSLTLKVRITKLLLNRNNYDINNLKVYLSKRRHFKLNFNFLENGRWG